MKTIATKMKTTPIRFYENLTDAIAMCEVRNKACRRAGNFRDVLAIVEHPDGWALCDLSTAIELELGYTIYG